MCKLIRERFPKLKLVVGVWGFSGDTEKAKARFERTQPDRLLTSLAQAVEQIQELIRPRKCLQARAIMTRWLFASGKSCPEPGAGPNDRLLSSVLVVRS